MMCQVLEFLPPTWVTQMGLRVGNIGLTQPWWFLNRNLGSEPVNGRFFCFCPLPSSPSYCNYSAFQIAKQIQLTEKVESPVCWVGNSFRCCRLRFCFAWDGYWHSHACGVTASHTLYWPKSHNSCLLAGSTFQFPYWSRHLGPQP